MVDNLTRAIQASEKYTKQAEKLYQQLQNDDPTLTTLSLEGWPQATVFQWVLPSLPLHSGLVRIALPACGLGDDGVALLCQGLQQQASLQSLDLSANHITDPGATCLARALAMPASGKASSPQLRHLKLSWNGISDAGATVLAQHLLPWRNNGGLHRLELDGIVVEGRGGGGGRRRQQPNAAQHNSHNNHHNNTTTNNNTTPQPQLLGNVGEDGGLALAQALPMSRLVHLSLSRQKLPPVVVVALASAIRWSPHLVHLELQRVPVDDEGAVALADVLQQEQHHPIHHDDDDDNDSSTNQQQQQQQHDNDSSSSNHHNNNACRLQTLELMINKITCVGAKALARAIRTNETLQCVGLTQNEIGIEGLRALAEAVAVNTTLVRLDLYGHAAGKAGSPAVWQVKPWLKLNQSTREILDVRNDLYCHVLAKAATLKDGTRLYKMLREMVR